jgi:ribonuclease G
VNTGKYVGKKDLEDTILKTNLEAVKEIAHQLRIRNCGGIIIIDLIDMEKPGHRDKVLNQLKQELARDLARTTIVTMSDLGLIEMTRKRIRPSLVSTLCEPCPYCEGNGYIKRTSTVAQEIFQTLEREGTRFPDKKESLVIHCHRDVADWIYSEGQESLEAVEKRLSRSIILRVEPNYHIEQFELSGHLSPTRASDES